MKSFDIQPVSMRGPSVLANGSISLNLKTDTNVSPGEIAQLASLNGYTLRVLLQPIDAEEKDEVVEIKGEADLKSRSQRMRSRLFVLYKSAKGHGKKVPSTFDEFYNRWYDKKLEEVGNLIDEYKS